MTLPSIPPNKKRYRFSIVVLVAITVLAIMWIWTTPTEEGRFALIFFTFNIVILVSVFMYIVSLTMYAVDLIKSQIKHKLEEQPRIKLEKSYIALNNRQRILSIFFDILILLLLGSFIAWARTLIATTSDPFSGASVLFPLLFISLVIVFPIFFVKFIKLTYAIYLRKTTQELKADTGVKVFLHRNRYIFAIIVGYFMYMTFVPSDVSVVAACMAPTTESIDAVVNKTGIAPQDITPILNMLINPTDKDKLFFVQGIPFERHTLKNPNAPEYFYDNNRYVLAFDISFSMPEETSTHYCYNSVISRWVSYTSRVYDEDNGFDIPKTATTMKSVRYRLEHGHYIPEIINEPRSCACCKR